MEITTLYTFDKSVELPAFDVMDFFKPLEDWPGYPPVYLKLTDEDARCSHGQPLLMYMDGRLYDGRLDDVHAHYTHYEQFSGANEALIDE